MRASLSGILAFLKKGDKLLVMTGGRGTEDLPQPPPVLSNPPRSEYRLHQEFVLRHVDFLIDTLTAEQYKSQRKHPAGCPTASPEIQCRKRKSGQQFTCRYEAITTDVKDDGCICSDPLAESNDPLDTVAALVIARDDRSPAQRYFDTEERRIIAHLRANNGSWDEIAALDDVQFEKELRNATNRPSINSDRVTRLRELLDTVADMHYTDGVTLRGFNGIQYSSFADCLEEFPGVSRSDAWWLMLVAFDKPVWPAGPFVDGLLCSLGLIPPSDHQNEAEHREWLVEELPPRQIPQLHRALAGHAVKGEIDSCGESCEVRKFLLSHRLRKQASPDNDRVLVDLFSGAGGLSLGFTQSDWSVELAIDNDEEAIDTYRFNHPEIPHRKVVCGDIRQELEHDLLSKVNRQPDVVVGGPPCQSLSQAGYRSRLADSDEYSILDDDRTELYEEYVDVIEQLRPKALVMENVEGMVNEIQDTGIKVGDLVIDALESIGAGRSGYVCDYRLIDCSNFGIPQNRERVIIIGIRKDVAGSAGSSVIDELFDALANRRTDEDYNLKQALSGLPKLRRGEGGRVVPAKVRGKRSRYVQSNNLDDGTGLSFNHRAREHPMTKDQILFDVALEPGATGWDVKYRGNGEYADLIEYDVGTEDDPRFKDKYRMLKWGDPAPTVVAHLAKDSNNFVLPAYYEHVENVTGESDPRRNRGITPREAARLQSFPDDFVFLGTFTGWFEQIGNAVPPVLGQQIREVLGTFLETNSSRPSISASRSEQASTDD